VRQHIWCTPYIEEDLHALAALVGVERILFGSDWPHGEGCTEPRAFLRVLDGFDAADTQRIMRENCLELLGSGAR
jgi:predicted TIM-barrel fold metal-dependent hydrolase